MSKSDKALIRLQSLPKDYRWSELVTVLTRFGFNEIQGNGSRVRFFDETTKLVCCFHKPHPGSIMKLYAVKEALNYLVDNGYIDNE